MHEQFEQLKNGGWKNAPEFAGYLTAVDGVYHKGDVALAGREFFDELPGKFLGVFERVFKQYTAKWRHYKTLPLILAGHPLIAKAFIRWLFGSNSETPANQEAELIHHYDGISTPKVNVSKCIIWLTELITEQQKKDMEHDPLISELMAEGDLQGYLECAADEVDWLDPATWEGTPYDFSRAEDLIWNAVAPRAAHQQRVENLVQTAGHLGKTNVGEARRSARAKIHSLFYRDFSTHALNIARQADKDSGKIKDRRMRLEGSERLIAKCKYTDQLLDKMEASIASLEAANPKFMGTIIADMYLRNKTSAEENRKKLNQFLEASEENEDRHVTSKNVVDVTPLMSASVILSYLIEDKGARPVVLAELEKRGIEYYNPKTEAEMSNAELKRHKTGRWDKQTITLMKNALKSHEHARLCAERSAIHSDMPMPKLKDITTIVAQSDEMVHWQRNDQQEIYKEKKGQIQETSGDA